MKNTLERKKFFSYVSQFRGHKAIISKKTPYLWEVNNKFMIGMLETGDEVKLTGSIKCDKGFPPVFEMEIEFFNDEDRRKIFVSQFVLSLD